MEVFRKDGLCSLQKLLLPSHALELESCIYNYTKKYMNSKDVPDQWREQTYNTKLSQLQFNLNQKNSPMLLVHILSGEIKISYLPYAKADELNTVLWEPINKKREYIEYKKNNMATTTAYKCRKCGERKCTDHQMQSRSADEPMTIFVECQNCFHHFRIG
jgi:DNA-directed RNA polymerase subunit M/transcription elongation factor TFIIS